MSAAAIPIVARPATLECPEPIAAMKLLRAPSSSSSANATPGDTVSTTSRRTIPFATLRILDLLADRDAIALLHEPAQILLSRAHRHSGERYLRRAAVVARRQRETEDARGRLGVVVEHLVEVAHPEEQDRALMPRLDLPVLLHQRCRDGTAHGRVAPVALGSSVTKPMMPRSLSAATSAAAACRVG